MHQTIAVLFQSWIDPQRALSVALVSAINRVTALLISRKITRDVQSLSHILAVKVVWLAITQNSINCWVTLSKEGTDPRSTLGKSMSTLVCMGLAVNFNWCNPLLLRERLVSGAIIPVVSTEQIIYVDTVQHIVPLIKVVATFRGIYMRGHIEFVPVPDAASRLYLVEQVLRDHVQVHEGLREPNIRILIACGVAITNDEASQVIGRIRVAIHGLLLVPGVDLPSKVWAVDPSIALSCNVELVILISRESHIKVLKGSKCIFRLRHIRVNQILRGLSIWEANTSRALNVEKIGFLIPRIWVRLDNGLSIINNIGSVLLEHTQEGGAARASIEPNHDRVCWWLRQWLNEDVMQPLTSGSNV